MAVAVAVGMEMGLVATNVGMVTGMLVTSIVGATVGLEAQPERIRHVRMKMEEKIFDFFMVNSPCGRRRYRYSIKL